MIVYSVIVNKSTSEVYLAICLIALSDLCSIDNTWLVSKLFELLTWIQQSEYPSMAFSFYTWPTQDN